MHSIERFDLLYKFNSQRCNRKIPAGLSGIIPAVHQDLISAFSGRACCKQQTYNGTTHGSYPERNCGSNSACSQW